MRLSQRATTNISVLALVTSVVAIGLWGWSYKLHPEMVKIETARVNAETERTIALAELAAGIGTIVEYLDKEDRLEALERVTNESNKRLKDIRNAK